ncbi:MAG: undecaprenyldiphospho-muramoylpentapeptide beta-N-acetylglucosaminyltransferase [Spirochaetaceae bacterium]|nr:undecaprenyldiphospho-muramoylpentapeptide beta-N-acetylglucosaminyltransferase [Spirochaetaceae bacterium]
MPKTRTIAFSGGGTGGHIYPGLAVIEALRGRWDGRIVWIGSSKDSDRRAVEGAGIEYFAIPSGKLRRSFSLENAVDGFRVLAGYLAARRLLSELEPELLFSKGGYVSVPPCAAAASLGIPVFTHESDLTPGLATRLNARRAERILVSYEKTRGLLPEAARGRATVVGNPVRAAIRRGDRERGRALLGAPEGLPVVFFLGGSQGARQVNELVAAALPALAKSAFVVHQTGEAQSGSGLVGSAGHECDAASKGRYKPFAYLRDEMPDVLAAADLVVGRSGAGTLWECAALGKPMLLVPLCGSGTRGDQVDNARLFVEAGAASMLLGPEATPAALVAGIEAFLGDPGRLAAAGAAAKTLAGSDAARLAADLILDRLGVAR